jgi:hypothetical protein
MAGQSRYGLALLTAVFTCQDAGVPGAHYEIAVSAEVECNY